VSTIIPQGRAIGHGGRGDSSRILQEALATGADPLHLALVFNIDHTNAMAYANAARNLLTGPAEQELSPHRPA
jgi:hypothetical protein